MPNKCVMPPGCDTGTKKRSNKFCVFKSEKISTILKAANVEVELYWPGIFAKALEGVNFKKMITSIGSGVGSAPAGAAAAAPEAAKKEEKKKSEAEESDDDMGLGLFD